MRQRKPFYNLEANILAGGAECSWRMAGKPLFRDGRFAGYVGTAANITTEFRAKETMTYLAYNDGLTGLSNRAHFQKRLTECVARLERYGSAVHAALPRPRQVQGRSTTASATRPATGC